MAEDTNERKESVKLNLDYFKTYPGFCKLILIVSSGLNFGLSKPKQKPV